MANDIDKTSPHFKGEFGSIYEVNQKFPNGGVAGDYVEIDGWAHYWNADRGTWCVNAQRDSYWDELITGIIEKFKLFKGATYMGVANLDSVPAKAIGAKMYYFATVAGTYKNFGGLVVPQGINVLYSENGSSWVCSTLLEVAQELGVSTRNVVSQKVVKDALDLKANQSAVNEALAKKADKETVNIELGKKADKAAMDVELGKKADKAAMDVELDKKADKETVNAELGKKADKETVNASLDLKANESDVVKTNAAQDAEISRKANQQDVERSLNILRKEIGERTVVEGNVNNNPDEEDLTSKMGSNNREVLSLKDREYNPLEFSGKGYKILRKNIQEVTCAITKIQVTKAPTTDGYVSIIINGVETHVDLVASTDNTVALVAKKIADKLSETMDEYVTSIDGALVTCTRRFGGDVTSSSFSGVNTGSEATVGESSKTELRNLITAVMLSEANTIYEIRYGFDLDGKTLEVPENCTLKFEGGSIKNGKIIGKNTGLLTNKNTIFYNIYIDGNWNVQDIYSIWFDLIPDNINIDNKKNLQNLVRLSSEDIKNNIYVEGGSFYSSKKGCLLDLRSNTEVYFSNASINILDNDDIRECILQIYDKSNVNLHNVKLVGDFKTHKFSSGKSDEWNHGIKIAGSSNVNVINANISYCVGDGIDLIDSYEEHNVCKNITIKDCILDNNGRQGISIESGDNVLVDHCIITNTSKIKHVYPGAAIDIEPWRETGLNNIHISHCEMYDNAASIYVYLAFLAEPDKNRNILIEDCVFNNRSELIYASSITFKNIFFSNPQASDGINFKKINNCTFDNVPIIYKKEVGAIFSNNTIKKCNWNIDGIDAGNTFSLGIVSNINIQNCKLRYYIEKLSGQNYIRNSIVYVYCDVVKDDEATCLRFEDSTVFTNTCRGKGEFKNCVLNSGAYFFKSIDNCILQFNTQSRLIWEDNAEIINSAINNKDNALTFEDRSVNNDSTITITQSSFKSRNISTLNVKNNNIILNKGIYDIKNITPVLNTGTVFIDANKVYIKTESGQRLIPYTLIGDTANRPTFENNKDSGFQYFDSSLSKPIWWTGTKWIDATGADV